VILEPVPQPDQLLEQKQARALVAQALRQLRPREERVVRLHYGVGCEQEVLWEVGARLGICAQRVRQVEKKALARLRHPARARMLDEAAEVLLGRPVPRRAPPTPAPPQWREQWAAARRPRPPAPPRWEQMVRPPVPLPPPRPPARIRPATSEDWQQVQRSGGVRMDDDGTRWECERIMSDTGPAAYFQWREQQL
jgi:hypothetical protein